MTKKIALLFPGQGSQTVGMMNAFRDDAQFSALYQSMCLHADRALNESLSTLIQDGPAEHLNLTVNTQPAMLLADLLCFQALIQLGLGPVFRMAGHSLGEYAALVAAGSISLEQGVRLVRARASAMQSAVPVGEGGMAAILGLSDEQVIQACAMASTNGEIAEAVNFNAPSQVVIAGSAKGVELACAQAKVLGAKRALPLPVSAPFHSSLMEPAALELKAVLQSMDFVVPQSPVINNIDVAIETEPGRIKDALVRQAFGPVRWVETIERMAEDGVELFIECGPGKVLAGLVKRITDLPVLNVSDPDSTRACAAALI